MESPHKPLKKIFIVIALCGILWFGFSRSNFNFFYTSATNRYCGIIDDYENKDDFSHLFDLAHSLDSDHSKTCKNFAMIIGGVNEGQLMMHTLKGCNTLTILGLEIQPRALKISEEALKKSVPNSVRLINAGFSDREANVTFVKSSPDPNKWDEGAHIVDPQDKRPHFRNWAESKISVPVWPLPIIVQKFLPQVPSAPVLVYTIIDTEGHEPMVIKGMNLTLDENRRTFGAFQFEIGGTWDPSDGRRPPGAATLSEVAEHLHACDYELYMVGAKDVLRVFPPFFDQVKEMCGWKGNVLAMHPIYAHPKVKSFIGARMITFSDDTD